MVAQVHDSCVFEVREAEADDVMAHCTRIFEAPIDIASSGKKLTASFPIDIEKAHRWS
jgi:DNA polymerase I-like protein with 3'-5' exonuclease and polymerase domains